MANRRRPPAQTAPAGGPVDVRDPNLKLAMLSMLIHQGVLPRPDRTALQRQFPPDLDDLDDLDLDDPDAEPTEIDIMYAFNSNLARHLHATPLTPAQLAQIRELYAPTETPYTLHTLLHPQWDGEDLLFTIRDLGGIEHCVGLEVLDLGRCLVMDLAPLAGMPRLRSLAVQWDSETRHLRTIRPRNEPIIQALEQRGVKVRVSWPRPG